MTTNQISFWTLKETERANRARESENRRTNLANETIKSRSNDINFALGTRNADISEGQLREATRANLEKERENRQSHRTSEGLQHAANLLTARKISVDLMNADTNRMNAFTNAQNAATNAGMLAETNRTNLASEQLKSDALEETKRSNIANENIKRFSNATNAAQGFQDVTTRSMSQAEQARHNVAVELETKRNNLYDQALEAARLQNDITNNSARTVNEFLNTSNNALRTMKGGQYNGQKKSR